MQIHSLQTTGPTHCANTRYKYTAYKQQVQRTVPVEDTNTLPANNRSNTLCATKRHKYAVCKQQVHHRQASYALFYPLWQEHKVGQ